MSECSHILELRDSLTTFVVFLYNDFSDPLLRTSSVGLNVLVIITAVIKLRLQLRREHFYNSIELYS